MAKRSVSRHEHEYLLFNYFLINNCNNNDCIVCILIRIKINLYRFVHKANVIRMEKKINGGYMNKKP